MRRTGLELIAEPYGRNGDLHVTLKSDNQLIHTDLLDVRKAWLRGQFVAAVRLKRPDIDAAALESRLSALADPEARDETIDATVCPVVTRLSAVQPEPVRWLWPGRIALGKLTLLVGDPGLGKSFLSIDIAARVSTGRPWPDSPGAFNEPGGVVMLSAEDDIADTIRPRLDAAGADVERVVALRAVRRRDVGGAIREAHFDLTTDLNSLAAAAEAVDDCKLVVIDPISAYLGATDSHVNSDVRAALSPLADLAARLNVAVLGVTHLRKGEGPAVYRAIGSVAFIAAARAAWSVSKDSDDPTGRRRLFLPIKNNLGNDQSGLAFWFSGTPGAPAPVLAWEPEPVEVSADDALAPPARRKPGPAADTRDDAVEWLAGALADGPRPATEVVDEALHAEGISQATLRRARDAAGVEAYRPQVPGPWWWRLQEAQVTPPRYRGT